MLVSWCLLFVVNFSHTHISFFTNMADNRPTQPAGSSQYHGRHTNGRPDTTSSFVQATDNSNSPHPSSQTSSWRNPFSSRRTRYSPPAADRTINKTHRVRKGKGNGNGNRGILAPGAAENEADWESEAAEPSNLHDVDLGSPQVSPTARGNTSSSHRTRYAGTEPGAEGQEASTNKGSTIQSAYERARSFASQFRRPEYDRKRKSENLGTPGKRTNSPDGEAVISMGDNERDIEMGNGPRTDNNGCGENERERRSTLHAQEANELVERMHNSADQPRWSAGYSTVTTPEENRPTPDYFDHSNSNHNNGSRRPSILGDLLRLHNNAEEGYQRRSIWGSNSNNGFISPSSSTRSSGQGKPRTKKKWWEKPKHQHRPSSCSLGTMGSDETLNSTQTDRKGSKNSGMLANAVKRLRNKSSAEDEVRITVHIAETISRQRYLEKLCEALMAYGAPTHRLEECMRMTAKVLDINSQFLYLPGCMFVSFDDPTTHTTDLRMRRYEQGVDLGRLEDVHQIYKEVVHDQIGVDEAVEYLEEVMACKPRYNVLLLILLYGFASAAVGPFAFTARAIDLPISFTLGCLLGILKFVAVPRSRLYANIFELTAALLTSFLARAFGSIPYKGDRLFCFPALAQSSIALILPGFMVLCSSLELQSQNVLAGSVRLVYSIIYSLVLGFGIMLGTTFYGHMDAKASSEYTCPVNENRNVYGHNFPSVIVFTICVALANQAKASQVPAMVIISFVGYIVNFFSARVFASNIQIANAMGAFVIGIMANLYSRIGHGLAAAAMLPAIFVQVPSGIASSGSLVSGLAFANEITHNTSETAVVNGTGSAVVNAITSSSMTGVSQDLANRIGSSKVYGDIVFDLAYAMVQVSISTTVGLFLAALVVYPEGKRRSEIFSF